METPIIIATEDVELPGDLAVPPQPRALVVFAHGSGSSRLSPRNRYVAERLGDAGIATLLFDLLTPEEDLDRENRFEVGMLAERLLAATRDVLDRRALGDLPVGFFGASTGAAAAIAAAVELDPAVFAVVSRGGRPDLAGAPLRRLRVPTLLIVGELDPVVIRLNEEALAAMPARDKRLEIVPGATHLFEEPGTLERVADLATDWLDAHLPA